MNPEEMLHTLKSKSSAKVCMSLDAVYMVCTRKVEARDYDFNYSSIASAGLGVGVPKAQSIRNSTGAVYRALIATFVIVTAEAGKKNKHKNTNFSVDGWIDEINDTRIRFLVQAKLAELAATKRMLLEIIPPKFEITVDDRQGQVLRYNSSERHAVEYLVSSDFLADHGFVLGKFGDVLNGQGLRILKPGTIDALKKALSYL